MGNWKIENYYDYQLSNARRKFYNQVLTRFKLWCCHRQLALFQVATCRSLRSLAAKRARLPEAPFFLPFALPVTNRV